MQIEKKETVTPCVTLCISNNIRDAVRQLKVERHRNAGRTMQVRGLSGVSENTCAPLVVYATKSRVGGRHRRPSHP